MHAFDLREVLGRTWQYCGAAARLAEPGTAFEADVAGQPVVLVHAPEDGIHAFYRVCQHRGGPVSLRHGHEPFFQCRYHGWTYNLDGSLRGTPQFERGECFDASAHGLQPVRHAEWQGLLFACLDPEAPPFAEFVAGMEDLLAPLHIGGKNWHVREVHPVECNWKVYVDNYLEAYHLPLVHPEYTKTLDYANYREEVHGWWSVQRSGELFYYMGWPNWMLNVTAGRLQVNHVRPLSHERCEVVFDYYYDEVDTMVARRVIADDREASARIQAEDAEICARVQEGLASPAYDTGCYSSKREQALHAYHRILRDWYAQRGVHG